MAEFIGWIAKPGSHKKQAFRLSFAVGVLLFSVICSVIFYRSYRYQMPTETWQQQVERFTPIVATLKPEDKVYVHGAVELLVLFKLQNVNPYVYLDWRADDFAGMKKPGGFQQIMDELESAKPQLVSLTRIRKIVYYQAFANWIAAHYMKIGGEGSDIYIRRELP